LGFPLTPGPRAPPAGMEARGALWMRASGSRPAATGGEKEHALDLLLAEGLSAGGSALSAIVGLWRDAIARQDIEAAASAAHGIDALVNEQGVEAARPVAWAALATAWFGRGRFRQSVNYSSRYTRATQPQGAFLVAGRAGVNCIAYHAMAQWHLGLADTAQRLMADAADVAEAFTDEYAGLLASFYDAWLSLDMRDFPRAAQSAHAAGVSAERQGVQIMRLAAEAMKGRAAAAMADLDGGVAGMEKARTGLRDAGAAYMAAYWHGNLAECLAGAGRPEEALELLDEGIRLSEEGGARWWEAELLRLRGEALRLQGRPHGEYDLWYAKAIEVAEDQESRALLLRAATERLRQARGRDARVEDESRIALELMVTSLAEGLYTADAAAAAAELGF
jgi:hypothetical protein